MTPHDCQTGNLLQWDGKKNPFYEIYYLKCVDSEKRFSFWARYTLLIPQKKDDPATASLWGIIIKKDNLPLGFKKTFLLSETDIFHGDHFIQLGDAYLAMDSCRGALENLGHRLSWYFSFEDPTLSTALYPSLFYRLPFPKTKFVEPRLKTFVSGMIEMDAETYAFTHMAAHQGHLWGSQYAKRWTWGNCTGFLEDPDCVFEGLVAQTAMGPFVTPPVGFFSFYWQGQFYRAVRVMGSWSKENTTDLLTWTFEIHSGPMKFAGILKRSTDQIAGVLYQGPNGEKRYCHNSMMANMKLKIFEKESGKEKLVRHLTAPSMAAFETVEEKPDPRVKFIV